MLLSILFSILLQIQPFEWSNKQLSWADYQGVVTNPSVSASTATGLIMQTFVSKEGKVFYVVKAMFYPEKSFVSPTCSMSPAVLEHEQMHFNITEVMARELRKLLKPLQGSILKEDVEKAGKLFQMIVDLSGKVQTQYDIDTDHSNNTIMQMSWNNRVYYKLTELKDYGNQLKQEVPSIHKRGR